MTEGTARRNDVLTTGRYAAAKRLLAELVAVPSVNPPGEGYAAVQEVLVRWLNRFGLTPSLHDINGKPNLTVELGDGRPVWLVNGHVDVVPVEASRWTVPPFALTEKDGRLYGRGTADMKGGLAAIVIALGVLAARGGPTKGKIVFAATVDEETGGEDGLHALLERGIVAGDRAVVAEPTALAVARCGKGVLQQRVRVRGRGAHAAMPHRGVDAIRAAARAVGNLYDGLPAPPVGGALHPLLAPPTVTVGTIEGGTARNVVASVCEFTVDRRVLPGEDMDEVREQIRTALPSDCPVDIEDVLVALPFETPLDAPIVAMARTAVESVLGRPASVAGIEAFTDARFPARAGIPTVVLGPGNLAQAHGADEFIEQSQLEAAVDVFTALLSSGDEAAPRTR